MIIKKNRRIIVENAFEIFKGKFKRFESRITDEETKNIFRKSKKKMWSHKFLIHN